MSILQTVRTIALVLVGVALTVFVLASFLWLPIEARVLQIGGFGVLLASMAAPQSGPRLSATLALVGSMLLSGSSYLAVSDVLRTAALGLTALGGTLLPILLGSIDARMERQNKRLTI